MHLGELQDLLRRTYLDRDARRGRDAAFRWMMEEVGELSRALRDDDPAAMLHEFGDVLAWLTSLATLSGIELEAAVRRYADGCPRCAGLPCSCPV